MLGPKSSLLMFTIALFASLTLAGASEAVTVYSFGTSPSALDPFSGVTLGTHLLSSDPLHPSVAGVGGSGISASGTPLDGARTYIYDHGAAADLADGVASRGDAGFAMMIWDMTTPYDSMRLYTHQDHYSGGPVTTSFVGQDLMEYSVWGSLDGDDFVLLSDVVSFDIDGAGLGIPTYTFAGTAPSVVYRGGSSEFGILNAYTREYVFPSAYRYYGVRTSLISLLEPDADPELDAVGGFNILERPEGTPGRPSSSSSVPEPATMILVGAGLALSGARKKIIK